MVDLERVRQKAADIRGAVAMLRELAARPEEAFVADKVALAAAKYQLIVAVEAALDLCNHLCAKELGKAPATYAECFSLLAEGQILSGEVADRLIPLARLRSLLVLQYGRVDDRRLHGMLREELGDFDDFLREVGRYLRTEM